jgi:hypothetical protein
MGPNWKAASRSSTQEITNISQEPKIHVLIRAFHWSPILSQTNLVYSISSYLRSILILSCSLRLGFLNGLFPPSFPTNILNAFLFLTNYATCLANYILLGLIILIISDEEYKLCNFSVFSVLQICCYCVPFGPDNLPSTLLSNTFRIYSYSSHSTRDKFETIQHCR